MARIQQDLAISSDVQEKRSGVQLNKKKKKKKKKLK